jgi:post-segregation antitoxin (ccd killing protein)
MAGTRRITVTLPAEQVAELHKITDNVSGYVAEAVARQIRRQLLAEELHQYENEHGAFTAQERAAAQAKIAAATTGNQPNAA